jgi:hypothetical protein
MTISRTHGHERVDFSPKSASFAYPTSRAQTARENPAPIHVLRGAVQRGVTLHVAYFVAWLSKVRTCSLKVPNFTHSRCAWDRTDSTDRREDHWVACDLRRGRRSGATSAVLQAPVRVFRDTGSVSPLDICSGGCLRSP